jgi:hypothetical protein
VLVTVAVSVSDQKSKGRTAGHASTALNHCSVDTLLDCVLRQVWYPDRDVSPTPQNAFP